MSSRFLIRFCFVILSTSVLTGCQTEYYRWQTVVREDGSVTRSISQRRDRSSTEVLENKHWERIHAHPELSRDDWPGRITDLRFERSKPLMKAGSDDSYVLAEGTFETLNQVPQNYHYDLEGTDLSSELKHSLTINDYGLVKEFIWSETITDVVVYEKIPSARRESIELIVNLIKDGLQEGLGDEYDLTPLVRWVQDDGNKLWEEMTMLILSPDFRTLDKKMVKQRAEAIVAKYGIPEMSEQGLESFLRLRFQQGVKRVDGEPVTKKTIQMIVDSLQKNEESPIRLAIEKAVEKHCGAQEKSYAKIVGLLARQVGIYGVPMVGSPQQFDVWTRLPGEIVETNGTFEEEGYIKWSFSDQEISPTGYSMTARSLFPIRVENSKVLPRETFTSRDEMLTYVRLIKSDDKFENLMEKCLNDNSLQPLEEFRETAYRESISLEHDDNIRSEWRSQLQRTKHLIRLLGQPIAERN